MLPMAIPRPLMKLELVIEMLVELAFMEILSSPLMTVHRLNVTLDENMTSAPSVFLAGSPSDEVLLTKMLSKRRFWECMIFMVL